MKPYGDRILIKPEDPEKVSSGGIIVPDMAGEKALPGTVVAVGPGYPGPSGFVETITKVGDNVLYPKFSGHTIEVEGEEYVIIRETDLFINLSN